MLTHRQIQQEIRNISRQLIEKYQPEKVILFGSAANGKFREDSDLDFLVVKKGVDKIKPHHRHYQIRSLLETEFPVDILVYAPYEIKKRLFLEDPFILNIMNEGKVLYGA